MASVSILFDSFLGVGCNHQVRNERQQIRIEKVKELGGTVEIDKEKPGAAIPN